MSKKIKHPITNGVARVPVIMQLEMLECGAASLAMIMGYYEKWITLEQARVDCGVSRNGSNAKNIVKAAKSYGMEVHAYRLESESLQEEGPFPCIVHWGLNHFVVLAGFRGKKAIINDPARGRVTVPWEEFDKQFTGICITMEPGENFKAGEKKKSVLGYMRERLNGTGLAVTFVVLTTVIASLMGLVNPLFGRIFLDRLLSKQNLEWFGVFMLALIVFSIVDIVAIWIIDIYSLKVEGKMAAVGNSSYLWKILRLPMQFFGQRLAGDLTERQSTNGSIATTIVKQIGPLAINMAMMVFYLIAMLRYNIYLTLIGVVSILMNAFISWCITQRRLNIMRVQFRDQGNLSNATISGISMIETIKASGAENGFFERWAGFQASINSHKIKYARLNQFLGMLPTLCIALAKLAILGIGVYLVVEGEFTIGMVTAFLGFLSSFTEPATSLIATGQSMQEMVSQIERVDDVMKYPTDFWFGKEEKEARKELKKLSGHIKLDNVTFGYSKLMDPVIKNFSMEIKQGQKVAIVGRSGCGKSTISKLISGLYPPWSGAIYFDGNKISEIDRDIFTGSVSVIDQNIILFEDTIANNIRMWDSSIEDFEVIMAARDAGLHDEIILRDGGYQHMLLEGGRDFSGGQRQRLEIARALSQDPSICILDEATSALDAKTEYEVVKAITDRGISCIVIAHRLSTIRDCDEIIVLEAGEIVERGTHEQLMAQNGVYTKLVANE